MRSLQRHQLRAFFTTPTTNPRSRPKDIPSRTSTKLHMTDIVGTLCNVDLLPSLVADESCAAALAGTCAALRAACSAEELWRDLACRRWPALLSPGVALRPRHGWRLLFRERAKLSGWRSLCPLLDASLATVAAGAEGWQETLSNQLLRLWEASARVSPAEGRHFFFSSAACLQAEGREEARRWRARLAALLAGGAGGASTVGPARLMPLCEWARGLAAELDSFYDRSCVDVWPHLWAQRIAAILRGRSALELLASAVEGGASGPLSPCGSSPRAVALSLVARPPGDRRGSVRVRIVACPSDGAVAAARLAAGWRAAGLPRALEAIDSSLQSLLMEGFNLSLPPSLRPHGIPREHCWWFIPPPFGRHAQGC